MIQSTSQVQVSNTKSAIQPNQLAILQKLSKLLDTSFEEVESLVDLLIHDYYNVNPIYYYISQDGKIVGLSIYYRKITSVEMNLICQLEDLSRLYLDKNQIQDISPLSDLLKLTDLSLDYNQICDISPLSKLTNLVMLYLCNNQIQNIDLLSELSNLYCLRLDDNKIRNISSLAGLNKLETLSLRNNQMRVIISLSKLTNLEYLYLSNNHLRYLKPIKELKQLKDCDIPNWKKEKKYFKRLPLFERDTVIDYAID
jgi:Leucine-rich repeat (LRR) protein